MMIQNSALTERPHVVIATPGRLADHIESGTEFTLDKIKYLVGKNIYYHIHVTHT